MSKPSTALWFMYAKGYLKSWNWIIVTMVVPTIMSVILYLAMLSTNPNVIKKADVYDFATTLPDKIL